MRVVAARSLLVHDAQDVVHLLAVTAVPGCRSTESYTYASRHSRAHRRHVSSPVGVTVRIPGKRSRVASEVGARWVLTGHAATELHVRSRRPLVASGSAVRSRTIGTRSSNHSAGPSLGSTSTAFATRPSRGRPTPRSGRRPPTRAGGHCARTRPSSSGSAGTRAAQSEKLAQLGAVGGERQIDPASDARAPLGRTVGAEAVRPPSGRPGRRTPARTSARPGRAPPAPPARVRAQSCEVACGDGRPQLGVGIAPRRERVPHAATGGPGRGTGRPLERLRQPPRAHGVGAPERVR